CRRRAFDSDARSAELDDVFPDIALSAFAIPLKLLEAWRELEDGRQPSVDPLLMPIVEIAILTNEIDLPFRKFLGGIARVGRQGSKNVLLRQATQGLTEASFERADSVQADPRGRLVSIRIGCAELHGPDRKGWKLLAL